MSDRIGLHFGDREARIFAMLDRPPVERMRATPVILVPPLGYEAICAHRVLRCLAERLCDAGFVVLRPDLPGTGDSAGDGLAPDQLARWTSGIRSSIEELRQRTGAQRVALFGLRMGALLALAAAGDRSDVASLLLWAAPKSGREWVRELRALSGLGAASSASKEGFEQAAGFAFHHETLDQLARLRADELAPPEGARILIVPRDDMQPPPPGAYGAWVERAELVALPGFASALRDPHESTVELATIEAFADFLERAHPELVTPMAAVSSQPVEIAPGVNEAAVCFGSNPKLHGVITAPEGASKSWAVLWLNAGAIHRIGMNRNYTSFARELASNSGVTSLRFDLAGLGDSERGPGAPAAALYSPVVVPSVRQAMDFMEKSHGIRRFVLAGLCAGAYAAFHAALADERVSGLVLVNPQTFAHRPGDSLAIARRAEFKAARWYRRSALDRASWKKALRGDVSFTRIARLLAARSRTLLGDRLRALRGPTPEQRALSGEIGSLLDRGTRILLVYSSDDPGLEHLRERLGRDLRRIRREPNFEIQLVDGADHTFTPVSTQHALLERMQAHISSSGAEIERGGVARIVRRGAKQAVAAVAPSSLIVVRGPRKAPRIALTFDDGPTELTRAYLDVLREHGVRATFFLVGRCCERFPDLASAIAEHGHQLAGHGFTHRAFPELAGRGLLGELERTQAMLPVSNGGRRWVRPPHGSVSVASLFECAKAGYTTVLWSWDSGDSRVRTADELVCEVDRNPPRSGDILLFHEDQRHTLRALPALLARLSSAGYELVTVDELLRSPAAT